MDMDIAAIRFNGNWKVPPKLSREFLAEGAGGDLKAIAGRLEEVFDDLSEDGSETDTKSVLYLDAEHPEGKGRLAAFVVVSEEIPGHQVGTKIYFRRKGQDLFVQLTVEARTCLKWMLWMLRGTLAAGLFLFAYGIYFKNTGQGDALMMEYARKVSPSDSLGYFKKIRFGYTYDSDIGSFVSGGETMSIVDVLRADPALFLLQMSRPAAIILAVVGTLAALIPAASFDFIAKLIGWPTIADFDAYIRTEASATDATLRRILENDFGVRMTTQF